MVGTIQKTGVEEARASALAMLHSFFMRRYNADSVAKNKAAIDNLKKRAKVHRT